MEFLVAISAKGSRRITVDGNVYLWRGTIAVTNNCRVVQVVITADAPNTGKIWCELAPRYGEGPINSEYPTPKDIEKLIRAAIQQGWGAANKGTFRFAENSDLGLQHSIVAR